MTAVNAIGLALGKLAAGLLTSPERNHIFTGDGGPDDSIDIDAAARRAVTAYDADGDGAISLYNNYTHGSETTRVAADQERLNIRGLAVAADSQGNNDGMASAAELATVMRGFDSGLSSVLGQVSAGDNQLGALERLQFLLQYGESSAAPTSTTNGQPTPTDTGEDTTSVTGPQSPVPEQGTQAPAKPIAGKAEAHVDTGGWFSGPSASVSLHVTTPDGQDHVLTDSLPYTPGWFEPDWKQAATAHFSLDYQGTTYTYEVPVDLHMVMSTGMFSDNTTYDASAGMPVDTTQPSG